MEDKVKYDPSKGYQWEPTTEFTLNGADFGMILNTFRSVISSSEFKRMKLVEKAHEKLEMIFIKAVEDGLVKESPQIEEKIKGAI